MKTLRDIWAAGEKAVVSGKVWNVEPSVSGRRAQLWREISVTYRDKFGIVWSGRRIVKIERPLDLVAESK